MPDSVGRLHLLVGQVPVLRFAHAAPKPPRPPPGDSRPSWLVTRTTTLVPWRPDSLRQGPICVPSFRSRTAAGWACTDIGRACGFFFGERDGERHQAGTEDYDPAGRGPARHSEPIPK